MNDAKLKYFLEEKKQRGMKTLEEDIKYLFILEICVWEYGKNEGKQMNSFLM